MKWYDIEPRDALDIDCTSRPDLDPPRNEMGEVCAWPWDPQQLTHAPLGMYHCPYCGAMCLAGERHLDYSDDGERADEPQDDGPIEGWPPTPPGGIEVTRVEGQER